MSNQDTPNPFATLVITGNPAIDSLIRYFLAALLMGLTGMVAGYLKREGFSDPHLAILISGALVTILGTVAVSVWGVLRSLNIGKIIAAKEAAAVQAGINLAVSGNALSDNGTIISKNDGGTPPKQVTLATSTEIVAKYAPPITSIAAK